jgi:hypothetical protein
MRHNVNNHSGRCIHNHRHHSSTALVGNADAEGGNSNSPFGGLFTSQPLHHQHHASSPTSFYDPSKMGQHLVENQFEVSSVH